MRARVACARVVIVRAFDATRVAHRARIARTTTTTT